jgi:hypothetical protein
MASTMKAVVFHGKNDLRFEDVPIPAVKAGQVKVCINENICKEGGAVLRLLNQRFDLHGAASVEQACHQSLLFRHGSNDPPQICMSTLVAQTYAQQHHIQSPEKTFH